MQMTPASTPEAARYRWEYWGSSASNFACSPAGMVQPSSSKMKWALPMTTRVPPTRLAMPCATIYSTSECISSWEMPRSLAARTTAFAMEWGKCSSRQAASCNTSCSPQPEKGTTCTTCGVAWVRVPVLSNTMVSAFASASRYLPPFTVMWYSPHSLMAESTASGMESFSAQEKSTIKMEMARVTLRVKA